MKPNLESLYSAALLPYRKPLVDGELLMEAQSATGLHDWGGQLWDESAFRQRFSDLCRSLEADAQLTPTGRDRAHSRLHTMLCSRLSYVEWRRVHPEADSEHLAAPLIGTGLPRSGTTFLHNLLAQDPHNLTASTTDCVMPVPARGEPGHEERTALYQRIMSFQGFTAADVTAIHPYGASLPEECAYLQELSCLGILYNAFFNVPGFSTAYVGDEHRWQREQMKALQAGRPGARWALKGPPHIIFWNEMVGAFPDGKIYINHRDPGKVIPSIASLYMKARSLFSDTGSDPRLVGRALLDAWSSAFDSVTRWRKAHPEVKIVDIHYLDLIGTPIKAVERLYDAFELKLTGSAIERMHKFLEIDHHAKAPKRAYSLADYGLDEADIEAAFGSYIEHYGIQRERR